MPRPPMNDRADRLEGATARPAGLESSVRRQLRGDILTGAVPPNGRLRVMELAARYGVAGTTVREALSRLASEGLVTNEANKGFRVAPVSIADLVDLTRTRQIVDGEAFRLSIQHGDGAWEGEIVGLFHRLSRIPPDTAHGQEWETLHRSFHHALISACGIANLLQISDRLYDLGVRYRFLMLDVAHWTRDIVAEHRALIEVALARDAERGAELWRSHLDLTTRAITAAWQESNEKKKLESGA